MQRVLDLDLDFFLHGATGDRPFDAARLDATDYPPWDLEDVMAFLEERCHLLAPLPGVAVEHHGEVFGLWRYGLHGKGYSCAEPDGGTMQALAGRPVSCRTRRS